MTEQKQEKEIPFEKICQFYGEIALANRFGVEREAQLAEQLKVLEARVANIEAKDGR